MSKEWQDRYLDESRPSASVPSRSVPSLEKIAIAIVVGCFVLVQFKPFLAIGYICAGLMVIAWLTYFLQEGELTGMRPIIRASWGLGANIVLILFTYPMNNVALTAAVASMLMTCFILMRVNRRRRSPSSPEAEQP